MRPAAHCNRLGFATVLFCSRFLQLTHTLAFALRLGTRGSLFLEPVLLLPRLHSPHSGQRIQREVVVLLVSLQRLESALVHTLRRTSKHYIWLAQVRLLLVLLFFARGFGLLLLAFRLCACERPTR